jgi:hypothetical protein
MATRAFASGLALLCLGGCTAAAPWGLEGTAGAPCFPDGTCDPGLACRAGVCRAGVTPEDAQHPAEGPRRDGGPALERERRDGAPPCATPPPPPVVLPYAKTTVLEQVVIKGSAPGAVVVLASGAGSKTAPVVNDLFCLELALKKNAQNGFELRARDAAGCLSDPVFVGVVQTAPGPVNLLYGLTAKTKNPPDEGTLATLTDGKTGGDPVVFSFSDPELTPSSCDNYEHLWFDLGTLQTFDQLVVRYPQKSGFKYYLTCWELLVSKAAAPAPPDPKHPDWVSVKLAQSGSPSQLSVAVPGTQARHVALLLYEDGGSGFFETFELTEVEAWGLTAAPPAETCP